MKKKAERRRTLSSLLVFLLLFLLCACSKGSHSGTLVTPTIPATPSLSTPLPTPSSTPTMTAAPSAAQTLLAQMSIEEKVAQLFLVEPEPLLNEAWGLTNYEGQEFLCPVGGVILSGSNIKTPEQCADLIQDLQEASKIPLFIAVDEEGGSVARIGNNSAMGTTAFPPMKNIQTVDKAYQVGKTIGSEIQQFGFNLDMAPVADVSSHPGSSVMNGRSFGSDPQKVAELVAAAVRGFRESGMLCTLKHYPGHGNTATDSHYGYTVLDKTLEEWRAVEKPPFQAGIDAGAHFVMLGHLSMPKITGNDLPATLSPQLVRILREELNYKGLIITDSMQMGAITSKYSSGEAAVLAVEAGADVILMPDNLRDAQQGILEAIRSGRLTEERIDKSVLGILELKYASGIISQNEKRTYS